KEAYTTVENGNTNGNVTLEVKEFTEEEKADLIYNAEAQIVNAIMVNGKYYKSFDDVFDRCPAANGEGYDLTGNNAITLLRDIEGPGLFIRDGSANAKVTFDFNGYTYTVNSPVGSANTATQAMHFGSKKADSSNEVTLKNGAIKVKENVENIRMALQNYVQLTIDNMTIDYSSIAVGFYGGQYGKYSFLEIPVFNNNGSSASISINNSIIVCPENSTAGVYFEGTKCVITNSTIQGYVAISSDGEKGSAKIINSTITKGVKAYFAEDSLVQAADGTYSIE
ncbi:MAG: hypothetical protein ACI4U2_01635, partial [Christensenellaceae bacterium]